MLANKKIFFQSLIMMIFLGSVLVQFLGCDKTGSPLGTYAPQGLDVPSSTPTPMSGNIIVYVVDKGVDVQGVSIFLTDPNNNSIGPISTQGSPTYYAIYQPNFLIPGTWKATLPTQGRYNTSSFNFLINSPGQRAISFTAGNQTLSTSPVSLTYANAPGSFYVLNLNYNQPGNLDVPIAVSMSALNSFWSTTNSFPIFLNSVTKSFPVTFIEEGCTAANLPLTFTGKDNGGQGGLLVKCKPISRRDLPPQNWSS